MLIFSNLRLFIFFVLIYFFLVMIVNINIIFYVKRVFKKFIFLIYIVILIVRWDKLIFFFSFRDEKIGR